MHSVRELIEDAEYVNRFIDEARVVVQLNHANICQVFDVGRVGHEYYLAMEPVDGLPLSKVLRRAKEQGLNRMFADLQASNPAKLPKLPCQTN